MGVEAGDLLQALFGSEEVALRFIRTDGDDDLIKEVEPSSYDVGMPSGEGVKRPSIECYSLHRRP